MRVSLIGPLPPELGGAVPGGVATHQAHLAAGLAARSDLCVALLATSSEHPPANQGYPITPARAVWTARAYMRRCGPVRAVRYAARLARDGSIGSRREVLGQLLRYQSFLQRTRPDVVHVQHPLERAYYVRQVFAFERRRWPLVVTAHSFFGEHDERVITEFMAPNLRAADRVIAVSPHIAEQATRLGVEPSRLHVIRSGIDLERFRPRPRLAARMRLGLEPEQPTVLFVGNLEPRKQVDVLLRALVELPVARLVVIGTGQSAGADDQTEHLQALTGELGLSQRVHFLGRVDGPTLLDWYAASDVFALPSSSEAQGIVALEAMASGLVVVASAVGGLLGTIDDGETGYLVPSGDAPALAHALGEVLEDAPRRQVLGQAARAKVERDFGWRRAVEATVEVYREALACRAR